MRRAGPRRCDGKTSRSASPARDRPGSDTPLSGSTSRHLPSIRAVPAALAERSGERGGGGRRGGGPRRHGRASGRSGGVRRRPARIVLRSAVLPASILVPIPDGVSDQTAAAVMLKGMTSQYLIRRTYPVKAGETVLFHAAAGGVGLIACQWLKALGATVIGTVGSDEKAAVARRHGCDHVIISTREDIAKRVREITGGAGVPVVYDSVGKDTFLASLDCLKPLGLMVSFGNSSGKVTPFDIGILSQKGSLYLTRPTLATYTATRADLEATAKDVFEVIREGKVKVEIRHTYPLADAAQVHRDLEGRRTVGSIVMTP